MFVQHGKNVGIEIEDEEEEDISVFFRVSLIEIPDRFSKNNI